MAIAYEAGSGPGEIEDVLFGGGWEGVRTEANGDAAYRAAHTEYEEAKRVTDMLASGDIVGFMTWLRARTIEQPSFVPSVADLGNGALASLPADQQGFIREGQNSIYRALERMARLAAEGPPATPEQMRANAERAAAAKAGE